jgi:hypothetical protein
MQNLLSLAYLRLISGNPKAPLVFDIGVETVGASGGGFRCARRSVPATDFGGHVPAARQPWRERHDPVRVAR